ncbi:MAG: ATP-binding protein [Anaerolineae bacterium]|nr:ATP-binding protein [Anaerolineae bacterium]
MTREREIASVSPRAQALLAGQENEDVDFKRQLNGLASADLVAFANSPNGGTIMIGVDEIVGNNGLQRGTIAGCPAGDNEKLIIINKAENCVPPIEVEIYVENAESLPFLRIEIPSGPDKPYCTRKGIYAIRGDGRTKALLPGRLLSLFMETEAEQFFARFREATGELEGSLTVLKSQVIDEFADLLARVEKMEAEIAASLTRIAGSTPDEQSAAGAEDE